MKTRKQRLFNNNPRGRPRLRGLGYGTRKKAVDSIKRLRQMSRSYQIQTAQTMFYRAKYHAQQTDGMRAAMKEYAKFLREVGVRPHS